jgi:hypothetical protein
VRGSLKKALKRLSKRLSSRLSSRLPSRLPSRRSSGLSAIVYSTGIAVKTVGSEDWYRSISGRQLYIVP